VLLIEDNDDTRVALRELLQLCGYDAHEALDGEAGLAAALRLRPDIVLLDIGLPKLDGYGVARRLKAAVPDVRLVALTGYGHEEDKLKIRLAGFDAHLLKPVGVERVREVIEELLDRPREEPVATAAS
jgi:CheY-like chemotaxis protein